MRTCALVLSLTLLVPGLAAGSAAERLEESAIVMDEIMKAEDQSVPRDLLSKASCAIIIPGMKKGAFIVGGKYGRGFALCRKAGGGWSAPAAVRVEGGNVGFQIGGEETDVVMLVMSQRGMDRLLSTKFTLGGEASVAGGPVGRSTTAQTDAGMRADILSWSRSRGVFAGVALDGATLRPDDDENRALYGKDLTNKEILTGAVKPPASASKLIDLLTRYGGAAKS